MVAAGQRGERAHILASLEKNPKVFLHCLNGLDVAKLAMTDDEIINAV